jgi:hypothetical protein
MEAIGMVGLAALDLELNSDPSVFAMVHVPGWYMPTALLKRVERILEENVESNNTQIIEALQGIVDAIRIVDAKVAAIQPGRKPVQVRTPERE